MTVRDRVWVKKCASFEEEEEADIAFWATLSGEERVEALEQMRANAWKVGGERIEGLRRVVRVTTQTRR